MNSYTNQTKKSHSEHTFESIKKYSKKTNMVGWEKKVRLFLGKFGTVEREECANFILPRHPGEISFQETTNINKNIRGAVFTFQHTMVVFEFYKERK